MFGCRRRTRRRLTALWQTMTMTKMTTDTTSKHVMNTNTSTPLPDLRISAPPNVCIRTCVPTLSSCCHHVHRGNTLAERSRDRELEMEDDEKDRLREREELEKLATRSEEEEEDKETAGDQQWARETQQPAPQTLPKVDESDVKKEDEADGDHQVLVQQKPIPFLKEEPPPVINAAFHSEYHLAEEDSKPKVAFEIGGRAPTATGESSSGSGVKRGALGVFGIDEEQEEGPKKKPLTRPSAVEEQSAPPPVVKEYSAEERKKVMKTLVDSIPTSKGDLFAYQIKWDYLDTVSSGLCLWHM